MENVRPKHGESWVMHLGARVLAQCFCSKKEEKIQIWAQGRSASAFVHKLEVETLKGLEQGRPCAECNCRIVYTLRPPRQSQETVSEVSTGSRIVQKGFHIYNKCLDSQEALP